MQAGTSIPTESGAFLNRFGRPLSLNCRPIERARKETAMSCEIQNRRGDAAPVSTPRSTAGFPAVLARARMIELMELAAARLMKPHLRDAESSVSMAMKVTHVASTTVGGTLRAVAAYAGVSGRLHRFRINVFDESGLIGSAEHTRAVVIERRLLAGRGVAPTRPARAVDGLVRRRCGREPQRKDAERDERERRDDAYPLHRHAPDQRIAEIHHRHVGEHHAERGAEHDPARSNGIAPRAPRSRSASCRPSRPGRTRPPW